MKYKIGLFFILFPLFAAAQNKTPADSLARKVLEDLEASWTLGIDSNNEVLDINVYNKFKNLFDTSATVDDDFNVIYRYDPVNKSGYYVTRKVEKPKTFDVYAHDVALEIKSIVIDNVVRFDSSFTDPKHMTFTIARKVAVQKTRQYVILPDELVDEIVSGRKTRFDNEKDSSDMVSGLRVKITNNQDAIYKFISRDTVLVTMALFEKDTVRITSIKSIKSNSNKVQSTNDADYDAVLNQDDSLPNAFGEFTANGMPDDDLDGVSNNDIDGKPNDKCRNTYGRTNHGCPTSYFVTRHEFDGFVGLQINSVDITLPDLDQLGYRDASGNDLMDKSQFKKGVLKNPGILPGIYAGGHFTWYFGQKKRRSGITLGFTYSGINAEYDLSGPINYTFRSIDSSNNFYRRQILDSSLNEVIKYNIFNFPVLFNYRFPLGGTQKFIMKLQAGPSFMIFNTTSNYTATIDFGGIYQINPAQGKIIYDDTFDPTSKSNLFFTSEKINAQNPNPGATNVFAQLRSKGYDFADNKNYRGKQQITRVTVAFNVNVDLQCKISEGLTIKTGPHLMYAPLLKRKEKYRMVDRTTDEYQSIYKGNAASSYSAFGVNLGFVYNF